MTRAATQLAAEQLLPGQTVRYSTPFHHSTGTNCAKLTNSVRPQDQNRNLFSLLADLYSSWLRPQGGEKATENPQMFIQRYPFSLPPSPISPSLFWTKDDPPSASSSYFLIVSSPSSFPSFAPGVYAFSLLLKKRWYVLALVQYSIYTYSMSAQDGMVGHMVCSSFLRWGLAPVLLKRWHVGVWFGMFFSFRLRTGICQETAYWDLVW